MAATGGPGASGGRSGDNFRLQSKVQAVDATGQPVAIESELEYPREAAEKPAMPADSMQAIHEGARMDFQATYAGISPEQEHAVQGRAHPTSGGGEPGGGAGGDDPETVAARPVDPAATAPSGGDTGGDTGGGAIPTASLSDLIKDGAEKLGEQIRDQLKDVTGFTITLTRGTDGSMKIDGEIKRKDGAVPTGGGGADEPPSSTERHDVETATHATEVRAAATREIGRPAVIRASLTASNAARPTQGDPPEVSSAVASNASANSRNNALLLNKIACIEGNALSINVCLINLTIG